MYLQVYNVHVHVHNNFCNSTKTCTTGKEGVRKEGIQEGRKEGMKGDTRGEGMKGDTRERMRSSTVLLTIQLTVSSVELVSTNDVMVGASGAVGMRTGRSIIATQHTCTVYVHTVYTYKKRSKISIHCA